MSYAKGIIPKAQVPAFLVELTRLGYTVNPGKSQWEMAQVLHGSKFHAISVDSKNVIGLPEFLAQLASGWLLAQNPVPLAAGITDTERLDFILSKSRQVIVEIEGWSHEGRQYAVYVAQGTMQDIEYEAVRIVKKDDETIVQNSEEGRKIKRDAIDLAINEVRSKSSD
jgi:hypothetical protein